MNQAELYSYSIMPFAPSLGCVAMKPSSEKHRAVCAAASRYRVANPRVFGSVALGTDRSDSDLDVLVDALPGTTLFDLGGLQEELETLLGVPVDLLTPEDLPEKFRAQVLKDSSPI